MVTFVLRCAAGRIMNIRSYGRLNLENMSRPTEITRDAIVKAAVRLFAEKGFQGTSVRDIIAKARADQAAIDYHFKSKDGLCTLRFSKPCGSLAHSVPECRR
jgi:AcrR family transcriptional regulator